MNDSNTLRIAAIADLHYGRGHEDKLAELIDQATAAADVLLLCGDLTDHGLPEEAKKLIAHIPRQYRHRVLTVLGNHDYAGDQADVLIELLENAGVCVLDGDHTTIDGVGFAGIAGFAGGFGERGVYPFGEPELREFINVTVQQSLRLETALSQLSTPNKVVLLHYSPIRETVTGEPLEIYPFLGSSRFEDPINHFNATAAFHGHAHRGAPEGKTTKGIPVFNVAIPVLKKNYPDQPPFRLYDIPRQPS